MRNFKGFFTPTSVVHITNRHAVFFSHDQKVSLAERTVTIRLLHLVRTSATQSLELDFIMCVSQTAVGGCLL